MKDIYRRDITDVLNKHEDDLGEHEIEIQRLKKSIVSLENGFGALKETKSESKELHTGVAARTCEDLRSADLSFKSGMYWIDPDGHGTGDAPIHVFCNMTSGC